MTRKQSLQRPQRFVTTGRFSLGGPAAETDPLLSRAYFENADYETMASRHDPSAFVLGRTGSGKSAAFEHLREEHPDRVIILNPENLALPYLTNLDVIRRLMELGVQLETFFRALWKHVVVVEVLKHRYRIDSPEAKGRFMDELRRKLRGDPGRVMALEYIDQFGDRFWCETHERVRQVAEIFQERMEAQGGLDGSVGANVGSATANVGARSSARQGYDYSQEVRTELATKYQRVVNETQLPRLNQMIAVLNETALDSPQHFTYLLIDDLDKDWVDESLRIRLVRCLIDAVLDMARVRNLKILVALRTNIFRQLDYGAQKFGYQEEKVQGMVLPLRWTEDDLRLLLAQRVVAASDHFQVRPPLTLVELLPNPNKARGDAVDFILERTMMRPRDAIMYLNAAIRQAGGRRRLSWDHLRGAEEQYSEERLRALRDEWKDPFIDIDRILEAFRGAGARLDRDALTPILDDIATIVLGDREFRGQAWLGPLCEPLFGGVGGARSWPQLYGGLVRLLFEIGFLGVAGSAKGRACYSYETEVEPGKLYLVEEAHFEIHPAFRTALLVRQQWVA